MSQAPRDWAGQAGPTDAKEKERTCAPRKYRGQRTLYSEKRTHPSLTLAGGEKIMHMAQTNNIPSHIETDDSWGRQAASTRAPCSAQHPRRSPLHPRHYHHLRHHHHDRSQKALHGAHLPRCRCSRKHRSQTHPRPRCFRAGCAAVVAVAVACAARHRLQVLGGLCLG